MCGLLREILRGLCGGRNKARKESRMPKGEPEGRRKRMVDGRREGEEENTRKRKPVRNYETNVSELLEKGM